MRKSIGNRGAVLIVVLGVLVVLSLLATAFASVQGTERAVSRNYLDLVQAKLAAQAGVDYAVSELRRMAETDLIGAPVVQPWRFYGDDENENGGGNVNVSLEEARNPSFAVEADGDPSPSSTSPSPRLLPIEGRSCGYSGTLPGGYAANGGIYSLKVEDASGKIHLNDGIGQHRFIAAPWGKLEGTTSMNLRRILNRLGSAVRPAVPNLGDRVLSNRPDAGYQSVTELKGVLDSGEYDAVADFVTAHAWQDSHVANLVPYSEAHARAIENEFGVGYWRGTALLHRFGRGRDYLNQPFQAGYDTLKVYSANPTLAGAFAPSSLYHAVYAMDELNPQYIEITSRAPVNVNAASREVLTALLSDIRGVFLSERRRNNIETQKVGMYHYLAITHTSSPANMPMPSDFAGRRYASEAARAYNVPEGDELGFLYETYPIAPPTAGTTTGGANTAVTIAEHLLACRESRPTSAGYAPSYDYSTANASANAFRGPFRSWRQFNAFCDHLAADGIVNDPRPIFFDHVPGPVDWGNITGNTPLAASDFERRVASQAIADALKANFNPNLHLNELNPDRNLFTLVDKTDLVVQSTEFVFTPTGNFDIESLGRVLQPTLEGCGDSLAPGAANRIRAEAKVQAGVKLFELIRETSQGEFSAGECSLRTGALATNNNRSLEVGPEPDNGNGPKENEWSGYVAFPTLGGNYNAVGITKPRDQLQRTPRGDAESCHTLLQDGIHTHLSWDFDAHYHADGDSRRRDMGSLSDTDPLRDTTNRVFNYPDPGEADHGPYDPTDGNGGAGNRYRLARSFRLQPPTGASSAVLPRLDPSAPGDLRIDGGFLERHSGLAYWISRTNFADSTAAMQGSISYWVKPNFFPERSGKPRLFADLTRRAEIDLRCYDGGVAYTAAPFPNLWTAGHDTVPGGTSSTAHDLTRWYEDYRSPFTTVHGILPVKPQSMIFGVGYGHSTGFADPDLGGIYYQFMQTPSLNHETHSCPQRGNSPFRGHEWMHVVLSWSKSTQPQEAWGDGLLVNAVDTNAYLNYKVFINGRLQAGFLETLFNWRSENLVDDRIDWTVHHGGDRNSLRFGSPSLVGRKSVGGRLVDDVLKDNFSPDSTLDEIHFWNRQSFEDTGLAQWTLGRYARPQVASEGVFTSRPIFLAGRTARVTAAPTMSTGATPSTGMTMPQPAPRPPKTRVLGISWTWFAEAVETLPDGTVVPILKNYGPTGGVLRPGMEVSLPGIADMAFSNDGYSSVRDSSGNVPEIDSDLPLRYQVRFSLPGAALDTVLLSTPVLDDVTLYVSSDDALFTYYNHVGTTP